MHFFKISNLSFLLILINSPGLLIKSLECISSLNFSPLLSRSCFRSSTKLFKVFLHRSSCMTIPDKTKYLVGLF